MRLAAVSREICFSAAAKSTLSMSTLMRAARRIIAMSSVVTMIVSPMAT